MRRVITIYRDDDGDDDSLQMAVEMACFVSCCFEVAHCPDTFCIL